MKQTIIPIASVAVGVLAFILTFQYLQAKHRELDERARLIYEGARKIKIVAAAHDIPSGTEIRAEDLRLLEIFELSAPDRVVRKEEGKLILGRKTLFRIRADKPILWSDIEGGMRVEGGLATVVKPGLRAVSISVSGAAAVSGMVEPNDRVDVLGTFTFPSKKVPGEMETVTLSVLQDVTVLATGRQMAKDRFRGRGAFGSSGYSTVTLEVTPREAELLVFTEHLKGRLSLSLRNPGDMDFEADLPEINFEYLETKLKELNEYRQRQIRHKKNM